MKRAITNLRIEINVACPAQPATLDIAVLDVRRSSANIYLSSVLSCISPKDIVERKDVRSVCDRQAASGDRVVIDYGVVDNSLFSPSQGHGEGVELHPAAAGGTIPHNDIVFDTIR
jgi:hypothetical protein